MLAGQGVRVVLAGRREERLRALQADLGETVASAVRCDVTQRRDIDNLIGRTLEHFGRVDILLANAGQFTQGRIADVDVEALVSMVDTNLAGVIRCIKGVLPSMIAQKSGDIIVTSSISGHLDIDGEAVYSASKHGVITLVNLLRKEVSPHGIRVSSISPGIVLNEIWGVTDPAEIAAGLRERRGLCSEDIAEIVAYMLKMPRRITLRDIVALPQAQQI